MFFDVQPTGEVPPVPGLADFITSLHATALELGEVRPLFCCMHKPSELKLFMVPTDKYDFSDADDKAKLGDHMRNFIKVTKPDAAWFISEAFFASIPVEKIDEDKTQALITGEMGVRDLPASERSEVMLVSVVEYSPAPKRWIGVYKMLRDKKGVLHNFAPPQWAPQDPNMPAVGNLVL